MSMSRIKVPNVKVFHMKFKHLIEDQFEHRNTNSFKLLVCLFYLGKLYKDLRVQFNAKQSSTTKFSLIRNIYFDPKRSLIISNLIKFYSLLMFETWTSDPKTDDIQMCHRASQHYFFLGGRI